MVAVAGREDRSCDDVYAETLFVEERERYEVSTGAHARGAERIRALTQAKVSEGLTDVDIHCGGDAIPSGETIEPLAQMTGGELREWQLRHAGFLRGSLTGEFSEIHSGSLRAEGGASGVGGEHAF